MDDKRTTELSDEVLDRVAGGLSMGSGGDFAGSYTYGSPGSAVAGPGAGPGESVTIGGKRDLPLSPDEVLNGEMAAEMAAAGRREEYYRDCDEYKRQYAEWQKEFLATHMIPGPEPVRPNPRDYL